jgi:Amt family ammonium transporter
MAAYLCYSAMLAGWVYPIIVHAIWNANGFLSAYSVEPLWGVGMVDFAGSGVVHMTGGVTALFATIILGPRRGRFHDETGRRLETPREIIGHSPALQMLGTFILWFGWYGFNCGSALLNRSEYTSQIASLAGVNSTLAGGVAGLVALFANLYWLERTTGEPFFDVKYAMNGCLCGLVAITAGCGVVEPWAALMTGIVAGLLYMVGSRTLVAWRLDDAVDAIPVHFVGGAWGLIAVGFFGAPSRLEMVYGHSEYPGWFYSLWNGDPGNMRLLGVQILGLLFIFGWVMIIMLPFFIWLDWRGWFRSDPLEEIVGLDTSYHGGLALLTSEDAVNPEYISAFQQKRREQGNLRKRGNHNYNNNHRLEPMDTVVGDSDEGATPPSGAYDDVDEEEDHEMAM